MVEKAGQAKTDISSLRRIESKLIMAGHDEPRIDSGKMQCSAVIMVRLDVSTQ